MSLLESEAMRSLVRRMLERAENEGGEEWLEKCLSGIGEPAAVEQGEVGREVYAVGLEEGEVSSPREPPPLDVLSLPSRRSQRNRPPERPSTSMAASVTPGFRSEEEVGSDVRAGENARKASKKRKNVSPSPGRGRGGRNKPQTSPPRGKNVSLSSQVVGRSTAGPAASHVSRLDQLGTARADERQDGRSSQAAATTSTPAPPAGESSECSLISKLLQKIDKLTDSLKPVVINTNAAASVWSDLNTNTCEVRENLKSNIPDNCFKEVLPCEISPLGFHLSLNVKEKIWNNDFIDLMSLLPNNKDFSSRSDKKLEEDERRRVAPRSFYNWLQAFCIFSAVLGEKFPEKCSGLFQHLEHILEAYRNFGGFGWYNYDESFRQKLAVYKNLRWGMKDVGLWLNLILPQKPVFTKNQPNVTQTNSSAMYKKGICYAFNESQCRWAASCRYRHECSFCFGPHPVVKCFKRNYQQKDGPKGANPSEAGKNVSMASALPRQGESGSFN